MYKTRFRGVEDFADVWFPTDVPDEESILAKRTVSKGSKGRFREFLSWIK